MARAAGAPRLTPRSWEAVERAPMARWLGLPAPGAWGAPGFYQGADRAGPAVAQSRPAGGPPKEPERDFCWFCWRVYHTFEFSNLHK